VSEPRGPAPEEGGDSRPIVSPAAAPATHARWSRLTGPAGIALVLVSALRWVLADWVTPFGWALIAAATWAFALFTVVAVFATRRTLADEPPRPVRPALLVVAAALLAIYGPWMELDTQARWRLLRGSRERALEWVAATRAAPAADGHVRLPPGLRIASVTGGEVRLGRTDSPESLEVLFYIYRGVPDGYAGFLHVSGDLAPHAFRGDSLLLARPMAPRWYLIAAR